MVPSHLTGGESSWGGHEAPMGESENDRQYDVLDQMLTAHALLRDRYAWRALWLNICLLATAIALNAFVFAGDDVLVAMFGAKPEHVKMGLGIASVVAMILSIMALRVDWSGAAEPCGGRGKAREVEGKVQGMLQ